MGLKIKDIIIKHQIKTSDLRGKVLAVDSMNMLYQFLTTIRGPDGSALTNSDGNVTSHLIGLFNRTTSLMEDGLKLVFVFDGKAPEIKKITWEKREAAKKEASLKLEEAKDLGDIDSMKKFGGRVAKLTKEMIEDSKELLELLGLPIIQAPSEGEAEASAMVKEKIAYASVSQDYDNLVFGCPRLIRNLSIAGRRKKTGKFGTVKIEPEEILLDENLKEMDINLEQLTIIAILVGTDYNPAGVKGIGQKKALKLVQEYKDRYDELFAFLEWSTLYPEISWKELFDIIAKMPTKKVKDLYWKDVDFEGVVKCLVGKHGFNEERVISKLERLKLAQKAKAQKGLGDWF